jgi:SAM-dependent methyltransferase
VDLNQQLSDRLASGAMLPQVTLTCLDRDVEALAYAKTRLQNNRLLQEVEFLPADLLKFAESEAWPRHVGQYDVVYSLGVANYFYGTTLNIILDTGLRMLKPGGELIVTHKALETFNFVFADWFCDWIFVQRSKAEFTRCFQEALAPFQGQYEWRLEWRADEEMFGIAKRLA